MRLIVLMAVTTFCITFNASTAETPVSEGGDTATSVISVIESATATTSEIHVRVGAHVAIATGSDIDSGQAAYGAKAEIGILKNLGLELAATTGMTEDDYNLLSVLGRPGYMDIETTTFAFSVVYRLALVEKMNAYLLGGISYNYIDADGKPTNDVIPGIPNYYIDIDADDQFGFQLGGGFGIALLENLEIFIEYRHVFTQFDASIKTPRLGGGINKTDIGENIDYGLVKIGLNYIF